MRKLIVSNLSSVDGYYEGPNRDLDSLFTYFHPDYAGDQHFDDYNTERIRALTAGWEPAPPGTGTGLDAGIGLEDLAHWMAATR